MGGLFAIERIANDGRIKPLTMCRMHAQLVSASSDRAKVDASDAVVATHNAIFGDGRFAIVVVDHLPRSIVGIWANGKVDNAAIGGDLAIEQSLVVFLYLS